MLWVADRRIAPGEICDLALKGDSDFRFGVPNTAVGQLLQEVLPTL